MEVGEQSVGWDRAALHLPGHKPRAQRRPEESASDVAVPLPSGEQRHDERDPQRPTVQRHQTPTPAPGQADAQNGHVLQRPQRQRPRPADLRDGQPFLRQVFRYY